MYDFVFFKHDSHIAMKFIVKSFPARHTCIYFSTAIEDISQSSVTDDSTIHYNTSQ